MTFEINSIALNIIISPFYTHKNFLMYASYLFIHLPNMPIISHFQLSCCQTQLHTIIKTVKDFMSRCISAVLLRNKERKM